MQRFCTGCGKPLASVTKFCGQCGAVVAESSSASAQAPSVAPGQVQQPPMPSDVPVSEALAPSTFAAVPEDHERLPLPPPPPGATLPGRLPELMLRTSRRIALIGFAGCALFVFFGLWMITNPGFRAYHTLSGFVPEGVEDAIKMITGTMTVLVFGFMGVLYAMRLSGRVFVHLTPYGFAVESAFLSSPLIAWSAVSEFRVQLGRKWKYAVKPSVVFVVFDAITGGRLKEFASSFEEPLVVFDAISGGKLKKIGSAYDGASTFAIPRKTCELSEDSLAELMNQWRSGRYVPVSVAPAPSTFAAVPKDHELPLTLQPPPKGTSSYKS